MSSGINSMATNALQDVLSGYLKDALQTKKTLVAKILVLVFGILTVVLAYVSQYFTGPVTQICTTAFGAAGGPVAGIFFLGAVFPQANKKGALVGGICGMAINMWIAIGSFLYGNKAPRSKPIEISGCIKTETDLFGLNDSLSTGSHYSAISELSSHRYLNETTPMGTLNYQHSLDKDHLVMYDLSYMWFGLIGFLISIIIGLAVSFITGKDADNPTKPMYIIPFLRPLWTFDDSTIRGHPPTEYCLIPFEDDVDVIGTKKENIAEKIIE